MADAAVDLFERQGVHATTVDDIARAAGISQRTFFRYFPTKEHAALLDDEDIDAVVQATVVAIRAGEPVLEAIEARWLRLLADFDARPEEHARTLRVRHLLRHEPTLLALALATEAAHVDALTDAATEASAVCDPLLTKALVAVVGTTARIALDEWARLAEAGEQASTVEIFQRIRRGLGG